MHKLHRFLIKNRNPDSIYSDEYILKKRNQSIELTGIDPLELPKVNTYLFFKDSQIVTHSLPLNDAEALTNVPYYNFEIPNGIRIVAYYENRELTKVLTAEDGVTGRVILGIPDSIIPHKLDENEPSNVALLGFLVKEDSQSYSSYFKSLGSSDYSRTSFLIVSRWENNKLASEYPTHIDNSTCVGRMYKERGMSERYKINIKGMAKENIFKVKSIELKIDNPYHYVDIFMEGRELPIEVLSYKYFNGLGISRGSYIELDDRGAIKNILLGIQRGKEVEITECRECGEVLSNTYFIECKNSTCNFTNYSNTLGYLNATKIPVRHVNLKKLVKNEFIRGIPNIYSLKEEDFLKLQDINETKAKEIVDDIKDHAVNGSLYRILNGVLQNGYPEELKLDILNGLKSIEEVLERPQNKNSFGLPYHYVMKRKALTGLRDVGVIGNPKIKSVKDEVVMFVGRPSNSKDLLDLKKYLIDAGATLKLNFSKKITLVIDCTQSYYKMSDKKRRILEQSDIKVVPEQVFIYSLVY